MIEKLISFFRQSKEETKGKVPEGVCPNCWGDQEYDNMVRDTYIDKQKDDKSRTGRMLLRVAILSGKCGARATGHYAVACFWAVTGHHPTPYGP